ncbi:hypothetical protein ACQP00_38675 [Dactylosporangium sp. CS-047395]|uniref:hypothetical protein n=1 Tax=Dactylosporangium sp. CS-047395 TaxID=3239936 RepID=UPI003D8F6698
MRKLALALLASGAIVFGVATAAHAYVKPEKCYTNAGEILCLTPAPQPTPTPTP